MDSTTVIARSCEVIVAPQTDYNEAWAWQRRLAMARSAGTGADTLLLIEHPPTITLGTKADPAHLLADPQTLSAQGIAVVPVDRGGDVTYHGPGQVVGYPIIKLGPLGIGVVDYVRRLEAVIIATLAHYGIAGERVPGLSGVWVNNGQAKIAAVGVKVSASGVTTHGWALNVTPKMDHFSLIVPCGIADRAVTSLEQLLGAAPPRAEVEQHLIEAFATVFEVEPVLKV
jgi:lipoyl(octanoyl) transferase